MFIVVPVVLAVILGSLFGTAVAYLVRKRRERVMLKNFRDWMNAKAVGLSPPDLKAPIKKRSRFLKEKEIPEAVDAGHPIYVAGHVEGKGLMIVPLMNGIFFNQGIFNA